MNWKRIFIGVLLASLSFLIEPAIADIYPVILHGKVMMEDGSPPPIVVSIERVCSDVSGSMPGVLTDKKGEYIWRMNIDPLETRNCVIRASHAGYSSTEVEVSGVDTTHTTLDLPPIVIRNSVLTPIRLIFPIRGFPGTRWGIGRPRSRRWTIKTSPRLHHTWRRLRQLPRRHRKPGMPWA